MVAVDFKRTTICKFKSM